MQVFSTFTKPLLLHTLLTLIQASAGRSIRRGDTGHATESAILGTTVAAELELWDPVNGAHYHDIAQGTSGDCWLDASMASVAYADSNHLGQMMTDPHHPDGTVTVTLWDGSTSTTNTVKKRTINDMKASYSDASSQVTKGQWVWPSCLEDAFMEFAKAHTDTNIDTGLNGGTGLQAFGAMYGAGTPLTSIEIAGASDDDLWAVWLKVGQKPTVSASNSDKNNYLANGLPSDHEYSAIRCDQGKGIVTLRNPWGMVSQNPKWGTSNGGGKGVTDRGDGVFDISFADWKMYFTDITAVT